jgi:hypothetical protein
MWYDQALPTQPHHSWAVATLVSTSHAAQRGQMCTRQMRLDREIMKLLYWQPATATYCWLTEVGLVVRGWVRGTRALHVRSATDLEKGTR